MEAGPIDGTSVEADLVLAGRAIQMSRFISNLKVM